jgi:hypothetical protein
MQIHVTHTHSHALVLSGSVRFLHRGAGLDSGIGITATNIQERPESAQSARMDRLGGVRSRDA